MLVLNDPSLLQTRGFVAGRWSHAVSGATFVVCNPASGDVLADVACMAGDEAQQAIDGAAAALAGWRKTVATQRSHLLRAWAGLVRTHVEDLALILTSEQGKPLVEARAEVLSGAAFLEWFAEEARRVDGEILQTTRSDQRMYVLKEPVGVCAAITPWNFPMSMMVRKVAPALAAGCTIVVKPAEQTPLSALALAELAVRAGLPEGVLSVICGAPQEIGKVLCESHTVRKLSFTGSTATGRLLMAQCAHNVKKLSLELGGNAPFIVFDDADVDAAVEGAMFIKFRNMGQMCISANRLYVQAGIYEVFVDKLQRAMKALTVGEGTQMGVQQGPLINPAAVAKVQQHIEDAEQRGATVLLGGRQHDKGHTFFSPTLLRDAGRDMLLAREETFGPVAAVFRFDTVEQVLEAANDTPYGLAAYFYSRDLHKVWAVAEALEFGMVGVNTVMIANEVAPFGGVKQSGLGREGSRHGITEYLELKYVCMAA
nr:NAD-dependent succinate-semialdehyde dehydrogenase [uncultured Rhodoferax sp.]